MSSNMTPDDKTEAEYITILIGTQLFGIPVLDVRDVFSPQSITTVPLAPPDIGGVLNLRGRIVTVLNIRARLGLAASRSAGPAMAVGIERDGESYGLLIDDIGEVLALGAAAFEALPETLDPKWRAVSKGVYRLRDNLLVVLDVDRLIDIGGSLRAA